MEAEIGVMLLPAKACWEPPQSVRGLALLMVWIQASGPQGYEDVLPLFEGVWDHLSWQPQEADTLATWNRITRSHGSSWGCFLGTPRARLLCHTAWSVMGKVEVACCSLAARDAGRASSGSYLEWKVEAVKRWWGTKTQRFPQSHCRSLLGLGCDLGVE